MAATAKGKAVGFAGLACPWCGQRDEAITLDLRSMDITCSGCDAEYDVAGAVEKARETLAEWERVQRWVEASRTI